ncbi:MAG TPA: isochorismatase family protein [Puia sp.]|nr:isochorismatase family protein [Puia sp.]
MITTLDKNTALVVIDLQQGIVKMNTAHPAAAIVVQSARLVAAFRRAGLPIVVVNVVPFGAPSGKVRTQAPGMPKDEAAEAGRAEAGHAPKSEGRGRPGGEGRQQSSGAREAMEAAGFFTIVSELGSRPEDIHITKKTWNAFYDTDLEQRLRALGVTNIVLCGIATSIGVEGTARAAYERGFNVSFVEDAMTDMLASAHENSLNAIFPRLGELDTTDAVIELLEKR